MSIEEQIAESQRVCDAATDGPWLSDTPERVISQTKGALVIYDSGLEAQNLEFIAHARTALPLRNAQLLAVQEVLEDLDRQHKICHPSKYIDGEAYVIKRLRRAIEDAAP